MALNIQIPYRGDQYLAQGISSAGQNLAAGIQSMTANLKKAKAYRTMAVDALGMDPDQVDSMSLPQLEGHFQAEALKRTQASAQAMMQEHQARMNELNAQAEERRQKTELSGEEAEAWPQLMQTVNGIMQQRNARAPMGPLANPDADAGGTMEAPDPSAIMGGSPNVLTSGTGSTGAPSPEDLMAGMAQMGRTSPRLAAALARTLIPHIMSGGTEMPTAWKSPEGNPYVKYHNTLIRDQSGTDPSSLMAQPLPDGYTAVQTGNNKVQFLKNEKAPPLPPTFHSAMDEIQKRINIAQDALGQPDSAFVDVSGRVLKPEEIARQRKDAQSVLKLQQQRGKGTIDRYHTTGYLNDTQRDQMYQELGLEDQRPKTKVQSPTAGYKTADEVKAAVAAGTLKKEDAVKLLREQFGMK